MDIPPAPVVNPPAWSPKNAEVLFPPVEEEIVLSADDWEQSNFPYFPIPAGVVTHVNTSAWEDLIEGTAVSHGMPAEVDLLKLVMKDLVHGADSQVNFPGTLPTRVKNFFSSPGLDLPRIFDSLATEVSLGRMAGPLEVGSIPDAKINGLMAIEKPDGSRRQVKHFPVMFLLLLYFYRLDI